jgi:hypothetical protein
MLNRNRGTGRAAWLTGTAWLLLAAAAAGLAGTALGLTRWPLYLGLGLAALLLFGALERWTEAWRKARPPVSRARGKLRVLRGGKDAIDLENDETHRSQKWLM